MKIELRWLDHGGHCTLQARTWNIGFAEWNDWQDVPVVHAEAVNHAETPDERASAVTQLGP